MFWTPKSSPVQHEIKSFSESRKSFSTTASQVRYINEFVKVAGITSFDDVTEYDISSYVESVRSSTSSEFRKMEAIRAVYLFMQYRDMEQKRSMPRNSRGRPAKTKRNDNMLALRQQDYTYDAIAKRYRLNKRTVYDIIKRLEGKG